MDPQTVYNLYTYVQQYFLINHRTPTSIELLTCKDTKTETLNTGDQFCMLIRYIANKAFIQLTLRVHFVES